MGNSLRNQPAPTMFGELKTPVTEDVLQVGLLFAFGIIAASFIAIIPGIRGWEVTLLLATATALILSVCSRYSFNTMQIATYKIANYNNCMSANLVQSALACSKPVLVISYDCCAQVL